MYFTFFFVLGNIYFLNRTADAAGEQETDRVMDKEARVLLSRPNVLRKWRKISGVWHVQNAQTSPRARVRPAVDPAEGGV